MADEGAFTLLQRDGVDDAFALHTLQSSHDHLPIRGVDHHGHTGNVGVAGDKIEKFHHLGLGVEQTVVHIDVDHQSTVFNLLAGDFQSLGILFLLDKPQKFAAAGNVAPFTYIYKAHLRSDVEQFQSRQPKSLGAWHDTMGLIVFAFSAKA